MRTLIKTISPHRDRLGEYKITVHYNFSPYTRNWGITDEEDKVHVLEGFTFWLGRDMQSI